MLIPNWAVSYYVRIQAKLVELGLRFAKTRLGQLLIFEETGLLRLGLSLASFGYASWVAFDPNYASGHQEAVALVSVPMHILLFTVHGSAMMYGVVTARYNVFLLLLEGVLGVFLWLGLGRAEAIHQGTPGPMLAVGIIAVFLLIRYPTHYGVPNAR